MQTLWHRHTGVHTNTKAQAHKSRYKHQGTGTQEYMQMLRQRHTRIHANTMAQAHKSTCKHYGTGTQEYMQTLRHRHTRVHANSETQHTRVDTNPRPVIELLILKWSFEKITITWCSLIFIVWLHFQNGWNVPKKMPVLVLHNVKETNKITIAVLFRERL